MQIHIAGGHKDVQNMVLVVHMAGAVHKVSVVVHKVTVVAVHIGHTHLEVGRHCTLDPGVWGCPIDLLVLKDFHIGHIGGKVGEHHTLKEQEGEELALVHSNPFLDCQNLLAEVDPMFVFEVVDAPVVVAQIQRCRRAEDP